ncbi:hypothetical protein H632_c118p1 [Helicosporidium sp. ATCC 50920]|nr:hypothetical protein H632_c118p1 [Helicosporidium sp. ATCC 50920]|eukprot:KDD76750.1 hypothetical protein H632_c118p1 [Helicosporidium sp. ATCC 50920]
MQQADVVLLDRLIPPAIVELISPRARRIYVGKQGGCPSISQAAINDHLLDAARRVGCVVRLKGGDPLVFGRAGEEAAFLRARDVAVRIVPGVTAASGVAADMGLSLTHRGVAGGLSFVAGHGRTDADEAVGPSVDTLASSSHPDTLVVYMGLGKLPALRERLLAQGRAPCTPALAVEQGTTARQRAVFSTLEQLPEAVAAARLRSPTLLVVGAVVGSAPGWARRSSQGDLCILEGPQGRGSDEVERAVEELLQGRLDEGGRLAWSRAKEDATDMLFVEHERKLASVA